MTDILSFLLVPAVHAEVATGSLETAVQSGFEAGANSAFSMLSTNVGTILIVFGCVLGIGLLMRVFKRAAR